MGTTVLIIGLGDVGAWALEFLAREPGVGTIAVADIRADWGRYRTNLAAIGASFGGHDKSFEFHHLDLSDVCRTAEVISKVKPDVVINISSLLSPRSVTEQLSRIPGEAGEAGSGGDGDWGSASLAFSPGVQCDEGTGAVRSRYACSQCLLRRWSQPNAMGCGAGGGVRGREL